MRKNKNNKNAIAVVVQAPLFRPPLHNNILCPRSQTQRERGTEETHAARNKKQEENVLGRSSSWVED
jgi:hypothetical protein